LRANGASSLSGKGSAGGESERFMAKRMGAKTIEVKASHLSLLSQPDAITNLILEAAGQT
jgi:hypothetical protein